MACGCSLVLSPRANGRLAFGPRGAHHFEIPGAEPPSDSVGLLAALMEHARKGVQAPSPRAIGRLACIPHGVRRNGDPGAEPPSDRSAGLRPSGSTPERDSRRQAPERTVGSLVALVGRTFLRFQMPSPRAIRSARLRPSWSTPEGESGRRAPKRFGQLACGPHGFRMHRSSDDLPVKR